MHEMQEIKNAQERWEHKNTCGVYMARNKQDGKIYIGSSIEVGIRIRNHLYSGRVEADTECVKFQRAIKKYGEDNFEWFLIEICEKDQQIIREQVYLDQYRPYEDHVGYNILPIAGSGGNKGRTYVRSSETKKKISEAKKGMVFSEDHKKNLSLSHMGQSPSSETIEKARQSNLGRKRSEATKKLLQQKRIENIEKANQTVRNNGSRQTGRYKGVYPKRDKWQAKVCLGNSKDKSVGCFATPEEAAHNYDYHMIQLYGEGNCYLNFPDTNYTDFIPLNKDIFSPKTVATKVKKK